MYANWFWQTSFVRYSQYQLIYYPPMYHINLYHLFNLITYPPLTMNHYQTHAACPVSHTQGRWFTCRPASNSSYTSTRSRLWRCRHALSRPHKSWDSERRSAYRDLQVGWGTKAELKLTHAYIIDHNTIQQCSIEIQLPYSGKFLWGANFRGWSSSHEIFHPRKLIVRLFRVHAQRMQNNVGGMAN